MSTDVQPRIVMCRPDNFEVSYTINPWMNPDAWDANRERLAEQAMEQWERLHRNITNLGAHVDLLTPQPGVPDMVFTANAAIVLDGKALLARFLDYERQLEEEHHVTFFEGLKAKGLIDDVATLPHGMFQEGAGDCLWDRARQMFWAGYGQRSRREACDIIADHFGKKVVALELVDSRYYHLDTCLATLATGHIVYFPPAFSSDGLDLLAHEAGGQEWLIAADEKDAAKLSVNLVNVGTDIVMAVCSLEFEARLEDVGFQVIRSPLPAFCLSGGAAACLILRTDFRSGEAPARVAA